MHASGTRRSVRPREAFRVALVRPGTAGQLAPKSAALSHVWTLNGALSERHFALGVDVIHFPGEAAGVNLSKRGSSLIWSSERYR